MTLSLDVARLLRICAAERSEEMGTVANDLLSKALKPSSSKKTSQRPGPKQERE